MEINCSECEIQATCELILTGEVDKCPVSTFTPSPLSSFWTNKTFEQLTEEQAIYPINDTKELSGDWPKDEDFDDCLKAVRSSICPQCEYFGRCDSDPQKGDYCPLNKISKPAPTKLPIDMVLRIARAICEESLHDLFGSDCVTDSDRAYYLKVAQIAYDCIRSEIAKVLKGIAVPITVSTNPEDKAGHEVYLIKKDEFTHLISKL